MNSTSPKSSLAKIGLQPKPKPIRVLIIGTSGVGKTGNYIQTFIHSNNVENKIKLTIFHWKLQLLCLHTSKRQKLIIDVEHVWSVTRGYYLVFGISCGWAICNISLIPICSNVTCYFEILSKVICSHGIARDTQIRIKCDSVDVEYGSNLE